MEKGSAYAIINQANQRRISTPPISVHLVPARLFQQRARFVRSIDRHDRLSFFRRASNILDTLDPWFPIRKRVVSSESSAFAP